MPADDGLRSLIHDVAESLAQIDAAGEAFKNFKPGVGPFSEPKLVTLIAQSLNALPRYAGLVTTQRTPDMLIRGKWAVEFKVARPFGDNGREAENWSVNLLHPYAGNQSALADCLKLLASGVTERKAAIVVGFEHTPPVISLEPLLSSFELLARHLFGISLSPRVQILRNALMHPVHQQALIAGWEVLGRGPGASERLDGDEG